MTGWIDALRHVLALEQRAVVVTVAATRGSVPREAGTRMIVGATALEGTIGGGHLEFEAIRLARDALSTPCTSGNWLVRFPLAARLGQCCGGVASLLFQPVTVNATWVEQSARLLADGETFALVTPAGGVTMDSQVVRRGASLPVAVLPADVLDLSRNMLDTPAAPPTLLLHDRDTYFVERMLPDDFRIVLFGNGHVGRALAQILGTLDCAVTWVDQREHAFPTSVAANIAVVATDDPVDEVRNAHRDAMFVVMTHSHALDFDLTSAILARGDFDYFGLIGSASKRAQFERRLVARGFADQAIARMTCPIGTGAIRSKQPGAIAVSVTAEILALRESLAGAHDVGAASASDTAVARSSVVRR